MRVSNQDARMYLKAHEQLASAKRIGIFRSDRLGDMVLTLPLAATLRHEFPSARIAMITRSYTAPLVENVDCIDDVAYIDKVPLHVILTQAPYDALFFPRITFGEVWESFRANIPLRIGSKYRWYSPLLSLRLPQRRKEGLLHEAEYNVAMLEYITKKKYQTQLVVPRIPQDAQTHIENILGSHGISEQQPCIILHPGSGGSSKDWSVENFGALGRQLSDGFPDMRILLTGTQSEDKLCHSLASLIPRATNLCGELTLGAMIALARRVQLLVANSTGVLHLAACVGTPTVGLFPTTHSLSSRRWGAYSTTALNLSPPPCPDSSSADDMSRLTVQTVFEAVVHQLAQYPLVSEPRKPL